MSALLPVTGLLNRAYCTWVSVLPLPRLLLACWRSYLRGDGDAALVLGWILGLFGLKGRKEPVKVHTEEELVLFGWKLSYFSGKVRGYLRYKARLGALRFREVVASPQVVHEVLRPSTGSTAVPQVLLPGDEVLQDSKKILEVIEARWDQPQVLPGVDRPKQRLACHILELLGDEWLLVPAFHWRWAYSVDSSKGQWMPTYMENQQPVPSHRQHNEEQWGAFLRPDASLEDQRRAAQFLFDEVFLTELGILRHMRLLGVTKATVAAWEASCKNILGIMNKHLSQHSFMLGGKPSTADYALLGPLYAHLYQDPVPGKMMREEFPLVAEWCERLHDLGGIRSSRLEEAEEWLAEDELATGCLELIQVFLDEMWPVLVSSCGVIRSYLRSPWRVNRHLPDKSFNAEFMDQEGFGPLTHHFQLPDPARGGKFVRARRMVVPHQVWMLQRVETALRTMDPEKLRPLQELRNGEALDLGSIRHVLRNVWMKRQGGHLVCERPKSVSWIRLWPLLALLWTFWRLRKRLSSR